MPCLENNIIPSHFSSLSCVPLIPNPSFKPWSVNHVPDSIQSSVDLTSRFFCSLYFCCRSDKSNIGCREILTFQDVLVLLFYTTVDVQNTPCCSDSCSGISLHCRPRVPPRPPLTQHHPHPEGDPPPHLHPPPCCCPWLHAPSPRPSHAHMSLDGAVQQRPSTGHAA